MTLKIILLALQVLGRVMAWLERERWKAEGRREVNAEALAEHEERVAQANAARADADAIGRVHELADPFNRDRK